MHTHPTSGAGDVDPQAVEIVLNVIDRNGVDRIVVMPYRGISSNCVDQKADNDYIYAFCQEAPDRLLPSFVVNPLFGQKAIDEIKRCRNELGINLLKLHPWLHGFSVTSEPMDAVAKVCQEMDLPIVLHDGTPPYGTPLQLARLCRDFPRLKVISGHAGLNDFWHDAMLAAQRYSNYYLCLCGLAVGQMQTLVDNVPPEQICMGSDMIPADHESAQADGPGPSSEDVFWYRWQGWRRVKMSDKVRDIIENKTPEILLGQSSR